MLNANQLDINLGNLIYGVPHKFKYILKNEGEDDITINRVVLGCGSCTKAQVDRSIVKPLSEVDLNVVFTPGSVGDNVKSISVVYNTSQELKLKFRAKVAK